MIPFAEITIREQVMADSTVNQFIDWGQVHNPPWQANDDIPVVPGTTTVFNVLAAPGVAPPLSVLSKGTGDGVFVTGINGVMANQNGNGFWWVYLVNGSVPNVGCNAYKVQAGDSIVWDYKHFSSGLRQVNHPPLV
jgi:hypothetical protein